MACRRYFRFRVVRMFTASVMPQDRKEIMSAGFDGFVSKPINLKEFVASVAGTLAGNRSGGSA